MTTWAVPGAKVVCVLTHPDWARLAAVGFPDITTPVRNGIYTIRRTLRVGGEECVLVEEIRNKEVCLQHSLFLIDEACFALRRFRPLVTSTQEADTAMFLSLLKSTDPLDRALMLLDLFELP